LRRRRRDVRHIIKLVAVGVGIILNVIVNIVFILVLIVGVVIIARMVCFPIHLSLIACGFARIDPSTILIAFYVLPALAARIHIVWILVILIVTIVTHFIGVFIVAINGTIDTTTVARSARMARPTSVVLAAGMTEAATSAIGMSATARSKTAACIITCTMSATRRRLRHTHSGYNSHC
jgi:hypothetical protein